MTRQMVMSIPLSTWPLTWDLQWQVSPPGGTHSLALFLCLLIEHFTLLSLSGAYDLGFPIHVLISYMVLF